MILCSAPAAGRGGAGDRRGPVLKAEAGCAGKLYNNRSAVIIQQKMADVQRKNAYSAPGANPFFLVVSGGVCYTTILPSGCVHLSCGTCFAERWNGSHENCCFGGRHQHRAGRVALLGRDDLRRLARTRAQRRAGGRVPRPAGGAGGPCLALLRFRGSVRPRGEATPSLDDVRAQRADGGRCFFGPHVLQICALADVVFLALHGCPARTAASRARSTCSASPIPARAFSAAPWQWTRATPRRSCVPPAS
jgi:hypothetical protein